MPPPIPDRWIPYKAMGKVIEGTRIICFKVPLRKAVQVNRSEIKEIWDIKTMLEKIPKLGAVIDLTNTSRYYDPSELQKAGILHKKILMPGRVIPPEDNVQDFMDTVDEFLGRDCEFLIGVHCTHGLNRTGYMVCRYMRDRLHIPGNIAIKRFEKARGYKIERENYVADILGRTPPPADLNFEKETKLKPLDDHNKMERRPSQDGDKKRNSKKQSSSSSSKNWRSKETRKDVKNWRSEKKDSQIERTNWRIRDSGQQDGETSYRKKRTDSEKSFDFKYDY